ncbi:hypothetical protein [Arthrobacter subterraneus]|uniref:hypothetical protein n=1 Tax=Arthrobacter subterraneus TaxID=335973 RepID=UPI000B836697
MVIAPWVLDYSEQSNAVGNQVGGRVVIAVLTYFRVFSPRHLGEPELDQLRSGGMAHYRPFVLTTMRQATRTQSFETTSFRD